MVYQRNSGMKQVLWRAGVSVIAVLLVGLMSAGCGKAPAAYSLHFTPVL